MTARGLTQLRRDRKHDFASATDDELLASAVKQVLATEAATSRTSGELPWRTAFGTGLTTLRHQRNDAALAELARVYIRDALRMWLPDAQLVAVTAQRAGDTLSLRVRFRPSSGAERVVDLPL
ncbi:MAG: hypothetical protein ACHREM_26325 [Polyangiales bacterium]